MDFFSISDFDKTGFVKTVFTTNLNSDWKYGEGFSLDNFTELGKQLGITPNDMIRTSQMHTSNVQVVTRKNCGEGVVKNVPESVVVEGCDGLITNEKKLLLCTVEADCVPVYLFDSKKKVVGMIHSGWKGTAKKIVKVAIEKMKKVFDCLPEDIFVGIGPHICQNCYEVGEEVFLDFKNQFGEEAKEFFIKKENEKYLLNLESAIKKTAKEAGVLMENIFTTGLCTFHSQIKTSDENGNENKNSEKNHFSFCSYRRTKSLTERMLTAIMLE